MEIYTIGFTQKSASDFFVALKRAGIKQLIDVRLNNRSQLAGFAKRGDLEYFLAQICAVHYQHEPLLAPTQDMLSQYRRKQMSWDEYEVRYRQLLVERHVDKVLSRSLFELESVLLCSEVKPDRCHRRIAAEYLSLRWGNIRITHL